MGFDKSRKSSDKADDRPLQRGGEKRRGKGGEDPSGLEPIPYPTASKIENKVDKKNKKS